MFQNSMSVFALKLQRRAFKYPFST